MSAKEMDERRGGIVRSGSVARGAFALSGIAALLLVASACAKSRKAGSRPPMYPPVAYAPPPWGVPTYAPQPVYTNWTIPAPTTTVTSAASTSATPAPSVTTSAAPTPASSAPGTVIIGPPAPPSEGPRVNGAEAVIDSASVVGSLADARAHVEKWQTPFLRCYALGLVAEPTMRGTVTLKLKVGTSGKVTDAWKDAGGTVTFDVAACMVERTLAEQFTPPAEAATLNVHVVLNPDHPK